MSEKLDLEFFENPEHNSTSYNGMVGELIRKVRYYRNDKTVEEFKFAIPDLKKIEQELQIFDTSIGDPKRNYIEEIMKELDKEVK